MDVITKLQYVTCHTCFNCAKFQRPAETPTQPRADTRTQLMINPDGLWYIQKPTSSVQYLSLSPAFVYEYEDYRQIINTLNTEFSRTTRAWIHIIIATKTTKANPQTSGPLGLAISGAPRPSEVSSTNRVLLQSKLHGFLYIHVHVETYKSTALSSVTINTECR